MAAPHYHYCLQPYRIAPCLCPNKSRLSTDWSSRRRSDWKKINNAGAFNDGSLYVYLLLFASLEVEKLNSWLIQNRIKAYFASCQVRKTSFSRKYSRSLGSVTLFLLPTRLFIFFFFFLGKDNGHTCSTQAPSRPWKRWEWPCFEMESNSGKVPRVEWKQLWSRRVYFPRVYYWWSSHRNIKPWSGISIMWSITVFFLFFLIILGSATAYEI